MKVKKRKKLFNNWWWWWWWCDLDDSCCKNMYPPKEHKLTSLSYIAVTDITGHSLFCVA